MYEAITTSYRDGDDDRDWYSPAHTLRKETYRCRTKCYAATGEANTSRQKAESLSQNSKNAKKSVIFIVVKGQLLTKFVLRYGGGHGTHEKTTDAREATVFYSTVTLTTEEVDALRQLSQDATDFLGRSISSSAVIRALIRQITKQGPPAADALFLEVERELKAGVQWGKQQ
jgi:hypothetical protein